MDDIFSQFVVIFPCTRLGYGICPVCAPTGRRSFAISVLFLFQKPPFSNFRPALFCADLPQLRFHLSLLRIFFYYQCSIGVFIFPLQRSAHAVHSPSRVPLCCVYRLTVYYVFNPSGNRKIACLIFT